VDNPLVRSEVASAIKGLSVIIVDLAQEDLFGIIVGVDAGILSMGGSDENEEGN